MEGVAAAVAGQDIHTEAVVEAAVVVESAHIRRGHMLMAESAFLVASRN